MLHSTGLHLHWAALGFGVVIVFHILLFYGRLLCLFWAGGADWIAPKDVALAKTFIHYTVAFAIVAKQHLRGTRVRKKKKNRIYPCHDRS